MPYDSQRDQSKTPPWQADTSRRLKGKVALITGVGSGIGKASALLFARQGAQVFGSDLNHQTAQATAAQAKAAGCPLAAVTKVDLASESEIRQWVAESGASGGGIDILLNVAADVRWGWIEDVTLADFRYTVQLVADIIFVSCQAVWPEMKRRGGGSIINISSANAHQALRGSPALSYVAGKGAVTSMTRQLAMEGAPHGIRANTIAPGLIVSAGTRQVIEDPERAEQLRQGHMLPRLGNPPEYAQLVQAIVENDMLNGETIRLDGAIRMAPR